MNKQDRPSLKMLLLYAPLGMPLAFGALPVYLLIPHLYATDFGMSLSLLGVILLAVRLLDAVQDPLIGLWSDRWAEQHRGRRLLILLGIPGMILGFYLLFNPLTGMIWLSLSLSLIVFYIFFSVSSVNYQALGAELSHDYNGRTWLTTSREAGALIGVLLAAALPDLLMKHFGRHHGLEIFAGIFAMLLILAVMPLQRRSMQRPVVGEKTPWWAFFSALRRKSLRHLLIIYTLSQSANAVAGTLFFFFVDEILGAHQLAPLFLLAYFLSGALGMPLWLWLSSHFSKSLAWRLSMFIATLAFFCAFFLRSGDVWGYALICVFTGLTLGADQALPPSLLADHSDQDSRSRPGNYFGLLNWVGKAATALGAGLILPLLQALGYSSGKDLWALSFCYAVIPALTKIIAIILMGYWSVEGRELRFSGSISGRVS
ncbi:MFS transporter [Acidithiobacillus thiooxidans]|uniref:MFS transporter n=1 Tax=Acidithiobacillus thiooxidans TaxID=930 RepID=UPI000262551D|nr:MFS transporter [Acidithiobacillus thiooxidans]MBU2810878.1 MFS transporter [Acidithiobacillus thiooxidans]